MRRHIWMVGLLLGMCPVLAQSAQLFTDTAVELEFRAIAELAPDKTVVDKKKVYKADGRVRESREVTAKRLDQTAFVTTLRLSTELIDDRIGFDGVVHGVHPLRTEDWNRKAASYEQDTTFFQDAEDGFVKVGANLWVEPVDGVRLAYGRREFQHPLLGRGVFRTAPRMYEMATFGYERNALSLTTAYVTRMSDYSWDRYKKFTTYSYDGESRRGKKESPVFLADITWDSDPFRFQISHARQDNVQEVSFAEARYRKELDSDWRITTTLGGRFKKDIQSLDPDKDDSLWMWGGELRARHAGSWIAFGYSRVEENPDMYGTIGSDWVADGELRAGCKSDGYYTNGVKGIFTHDGETARKLSIGHEFSGGWMEGVSIQAYVISGDGVHKGYEGLNRKDHVEYGGVISWAPSFLPGFEIRVAHGRDDMESEEAFESSRTTTYYSETQEMETTLVECRYTIPFGEPIAHRARAERPSCVGL